MTTHQTEIGASSEGIDLSLAVMIVVGIGVISICTFWMHLVTKRWFSLTHGEGWEFGAVVWSCFFCIYYYVKLPQTKKG